MFSGHLTGVRLCVLLGFRRVVITFAGVLFISDPLVLAADVKEHVGKPVLEVQLIREGRPVHDQSLLDLVETKVDEPFTVRQVRESLLHLFTLGQFQDIRVDAVLQPRGVVLQYDLVPFHVFEQIKFRGNLGFSRDRLQGIITERYGPNPRLDLVTELVNELTLTYRDQGYLNPWIVADVERSRERDTLVFNINAGPKVRVGSIDLQGKSLEPRKELLSRLNLKEGEIYDRDAIERRLTDYENELRSQRYYEAELKHTIKEREDARSVDVTLHIDSGPRVTVNFEGDPLREGVQTELVPVAREGSVDEALLEDSSRRIEDYLRERAYWKAEVFHSREAIGAELSIVFSVQTGARYTVAGVEIFGNRAVALQDIKTRLDIDPGDPFVEDDFEMGVNEVIEHYLRLGYLEVQVEHTLTEVVHQGSGGDETATVIAKLLINEGTPTIIGAIRFEGNSNLAHVDIRKVIKARPGQPYYAPQIRSDREAVRLLYLNDGYDEVAVRVDLEPSAEDKLSDLIFSIQEGSQVVVGHILVVGNRKIKASTIRREIALQEGQPLGLAAVFETRRRLNRLGLFRQIDIREFSHGSNASRDVVVVVDEAPATTIAYGAGLEVGQRLRRADESGGGQAVERLEAAPRGFFQIGRRNLWGKNRSIDLFTRVSIRRGDAQETDSAVSNFRFNEYRLLSTYREPRAFGFDADVLVRGFLEQAIRSSFNLYRRGVNVEIRRAVHPTLSIGGGYTFDKNRLSEVRFNPADKLLIDRLYPEVLLSTFSGVFVRDTRDDPFQPTGGTLLGLDTEIAGRRIGSEVGFAKAFLQAFIYRPWPGSRRVLFAAGARFGFARGFLRDVAVSDETGNLVLGVDGQPITVALADLPASKRFFAGGDTTVRGFVLDRLGDDIRHAPPGTEPTIDQDGFPRGGDAVVVLNSELRVPVWRDLGAVAFIDAGNVFDRVSNMDLRRIRTAAGVGIRYRSPVGPIRVDLGFKLDRRRLANGEQERLTALHISIGQAF